MKQWMFLVILIISQLFLTANAANQLQQAINAIIMQANLPATIGVVIQSAKTGNILYQKNPNQLFVPASNLKLLTSIAGLLYLGPDYQFQTVVATDAENITNGILNGNLYIKFSGDPDFTLEKLNSLIVMLKQDNINSIKGNVYIDGSAYNDNLQGPGWMWDELNICYAAPITAVMINHNCFSTTLSPGKAAGNPADLSAFSMSELTPIHNQVITSSASQENCAVDLKLVGQNQYALIGCINPQSDPLYLQIAIRNPVLYARQLIAELLRANDIGLQGSIGEGVMPAGSKQLVIANSKPLSLLTKQMLKNSDNQIADAIFMTLGTKYFQQPATWQNGIKALQSILAKAFPVNFTNVNIVDGAGISRYNLVTPRLFAQLLYGAYHNPAIASYLMDALPIAGEDGTLKDRMQGDKVRGKLHAKTGSMTGVSALSGYVTSASGKVFIFTILINNFLPHDKIRAYQLENKIGDYLYSL